MLFMTEIHGVAVRVDRVDLDDAEEIVAICRRGRLNIRRRLGSYAGARASRIVISAVSTAPAGITPGTPRSP